MIGRDTTPRPHRYAFRAKIERRRRRAQLAAYVIGFGPLEEALQLFASVADADDEHAAGQVVERPSVAHARVARTLLPKDELEKRAQGPAVKRLPGRSPAPS